MRRLQSNCDVVLSVSYHILWFLHVSLSGCVCVSMSHLCAVLMEHTELTFVVLALKCSSNNGGRVSPLLTCVVGLPTAPCLLSVCLLSRVFDSSLPQLSLSGLGTLKLCMGRYVWDAVYV